MSALAVMLKYPLQSPGRYTRAQSEILYNQKSRGIRDFFEKNCIGLPGLAFTGVTTGTGITAFAGVTALSGITTLAGISALACCRR